MFQVINQSEKCNPYIASRIVKIGKGFFDRQKPFSLIAGKLHYKQSEPNNLIIFSGPRRTGKTSLLKQLQNSLSKDAFLPIYIDPDGQAATPFLNFLLDLVKNIANEARFRLPPKLIIDECGESFTHEFLPLLFKHINSNQRPLLLIDEFEPLEQEKYERLPSNATAKRLVPFIHNLINIEPRFAIALATGKNHFQTTEHLGIKPYNIWTLNQECAEILIRQAEINQTLSFSDAAVSEILTLTNGHPFWIQALCFQVWQQIHNQRGSKYNVELSDVNNAVSSVFQMHAPSCDYIWEGLTSVERSFAEIIAADALQQHIIFTENQVIDIIQENHLDITLKKLVERHLLETISSHEYQFTIPIFRKWIQQRPIQNSQEHKQPFLLEYHKGSILFDQGLWIESIDYFEQALIKQPGHEKSMIRAGMAYLEIKNPQDALKLFDKANEILIKTFANDLAEGYSRYAEYINDEQSIQYCNRALALTENKCLIARKIKGDILVRLGREEMTRLDFVKAREYYVQAEANDEVRMIDLLKPSALSYLLISHLSLDSGTYDITILEKSSDTIHTKERASSKLSVSVNDVWRQDLKGRGHAAFKQFLGGDEGELLSNLENAIQILTDNPDIPWELLHDGHDFLCLKLPVARGVLTSSKRSYRRTLSDTTEKQQKVLIIGVPNDFDEPTANESLPTVADEVNAIRDLLITKKYNVEILIGPKEANFENIVMRLANTKYDIIHFAGHGYFNPDTPVANGLMLGDKILSIDELKHCLEGNPFVFINACDGAKTKTTAMGTHGRIIDGIAIALLESNASGCLAPLWPVEDDLAKDFAIKFYTETIKNGQSIGEAVRLARIAFKKREDESPDFWASWVLYGFTNHKLV